ncbi:MAG: PAS domain-containing hybrid sensor histidine kinase/response regulator [Thermodesulfobacteriota bacterium]|nr:MAG: PAS domain-containing hybrid sensor histidine kinase/response regulator [Thermodesulfobacteriota bacterium]
MKMTPYRSAAQLVIIMTVAIYTIEFMVMRLASFPHESSTVHALINSSILIILLVPFLYLFLFRPLLLQLKERQKVEEDLIRERDRAQRYLDVAGVMLIVLDPAGTVTLINKRGCEILGYGEKEVVGRDWFDNFLPPQYRDFARESFRSLLVGEDDAKRPLEHPVLTRSGEERIIHWHHTVLRQNGHVLGTLSSGEDITERKRMENSLRESETRYRLIHDTAFDAIIIADSDDKIVECNPSAEKMFGYERGELNGEIILKLMPEKYRTPHIEGLKRFLDTGRSKVQGKVLELEGLRKDGEVFPIELILSNFKVGGRVLFSGTIRDITERKKAEEEKEIIQTQLNQAQKMEAIGRLAGGIAHDFNNILTTIRGNAELGLELVSKKDPVYPGLSEIIRSVAHASKLTRQLLLFSRGHPLELLPIDINSAVENLLTMLKRLIGEDIEVVVKTGTGLWTVMADEGNIEQVVLNLAVNARDSMPAGGTLTITTENVVLNEEAARKIPGAVAGKSVCLSVKDTGSGMKKEILNRIFDPFFTTKAAGTGLGLSVVYGIVRQHGGWIDVKSAPGAGTEFRVYLPAITGEEKKEAEKIESPPPGGVSGKGERILLIEDDEGVRTVARETLAEKGYKVFDVGSAGEALDLFEKEGGRFDLIFSDVVLPDINGIKLVEKLLEKKPGLSVLLTSGYVDDKAHWNVIKEKGFGLLQKPYSLTELLETVKKVLGEEGRGG